MEIGNLILANGATNGKLDSKPALQKLPIPKALHYAYYNLCKRHITIGTTPAVAAGVSDHIWSIPELIENAAQSLPEKEMGL